jgi:two-component system response regulator FixJ
LFVKKQQKKQNNNDKTRLDKVEQTQTKLASLTHRETQILDAIVTGKANKVIAFELNLSQRTIEVHRAHVMEKMDVKSLAELVKVVIDASPTE